MSPMKKFKKHLLSAMDCPCSALTINCCQLGCFIADEPIVEYRISNESWMHALTQAAPSLKLRDLVVPGSHDSATCTIPKSKLFSGVGLCQNGSVMEQAQRGCRYLDVRVAGTGDDPHAVDIYHGFLKGGSFQGVLDQIKQFLSDHPGEFIFLEVVREYGRDMTPEQSKHALDMVQSTFGDMLFQETDLTKLLNRMTLKDLADRGTQVCCLVHSRIYNFEVEGKKYTEEYIVNNYCFFNSNRWMRSHWHNTRDVDKLLEWNLEEVDKHGTNRNILLNNQMLLTPGVGGVGDVVSLLIGKSSLRPVSFATTLYQKDVLDDYMREHADKPWNLLMLDFVDLAPALLSFLIGLNFPEPVKILAAAASPGGRSSSTDVTNKIQAYVKRGKVLYLTNIQKDLGLEYSEGKLTIAYQVGSNKHQILDVDFDPSTEIVVGQYSHNEGVLVHVDPTTDGVFHHGRILGKDEYESSGSKDGTALRITPDGGGRMAFSVVS